jgi:aryl-alcohol dehydrogenase-like predicted oxidoreductase
MKVLYIGGTGTISSACVAESVRQGQDVHVLNRGRTVGRRPLPEGVTTIAGDVQDRESMRYAYGHTDESVRDAVRAMWGACEAYGVPLAAAALQFSLRDPRVTSTIVGLSEPTRIAATVELATASIPDALWDELDRYVPEQAGWLD